MTKKIIFYLIEYIETITTTVSQEYNNNVYEMPCL